MALTGKAAKALEQVKNGLSMLYGADYFTEDEWVKIDGLIHKGQYVFTTGPPTTNFLEDELMSFDDTKAADAPLELQSEVMETFDLAAKEIVQETIPETIEKVQHEATPVTDNQNVSVDPTIPELTIAASTETHVPETLEISSDEEPALVPEATAAALDESSFDLSSDLTQQPVQEPEPVEKSFKELVERKPIERPANGGLAYYSKEQLEELKAFNAGLTRAKKAPRNKAQNSYPSPDESEQDPWMGEETYQQDTGPTHDYPSPATTDDESRIHNWASGVNAEANIAPTADSKNRLVSEFIKKNGRLPKSINEYYQPNNPKFTPLTTRPASRATSIRPIKTSVSTSIASVVAALNPGSATQHLHDVIGKTLIAQSSAEAAPGQIRIEVREGDSIKILKHVSGVLHYGQNLRTEKFGQFNEAIFRRPTGAQIAAAKARMYHVPNRPASRVDSFGFERANASEWDEVPVTTRPKTVAPAPVRPIGNGLASSRYAVLTDADTKSETSESVSQGMTREDVDKLVDEKVAKLLLGKGNSPYGSAKVARSPRPKQKFVEPLPKVEPKTATCWFWVTPGKDCRFTAEECRDLHGYADTDPNANPANLRMGKPTWGALADSDGPTSPLPDGHNIRVASHLQSSKSGFTPVQSSTNNPSGKRTCYFWASNEGKCQYSAEECKYLHDWSEFGIAHAPGWGSAKVQNWSRWENKDHPHRKTEAQSQNGGWGEPSAGWGDDDTNNASWDTPADATTEHAEGEMVIQEVQNHEQPVTSWGDSTWEATSSVAEAWGQAPIQMNNPNSASVSAWGDVDPGKPAHVRSLEEKARIETFGW